MVWHEWYTDIPPAHLPSVSIPSSQSQCVAITISTSVLQKDQDWLMDDSVTPWSVFHSKQSLPLTKDPDISAMLPIWRNSSKSPATIKHLLNVLIQAIHYLNEGQAAVVGFDQPLYAIAKRLQWHQPVLYGQDKLVIMLGALHTEMVILGCLGDWLQDSG